MSVPAYQIENILTLYCRKLEQTWRGSTSPGETGTLPHPPASFIGHSKKEAIINKVTDSIISRITHMGPHQYMEDKNHPHRPGRMDPPKTDSPDTPHRKTGRFSFVCLDEENRRSWKSITLEKKKEVPQEQPPRRTDPVTTSK